LHWSLSFHFSFYRAHRESNPISGEEEGTAEKKKVKKKKPKEG